MLHKLVTLTWFGTMATLTLALLSESAHLRTPDQQGYSLYLKNNYKESANTFNDSYWKAIALYAAGEFKQSEAILTGYTTAEAHYNRGNAQLLQGKYQEAADSYQSALELKPEWQAALSNRALALARAELLKQTGGDMTGGKLAADDIRINDQPSTSNSEQTETSLEQTELTDAEIRALWLRDVRTNPADFLRAKFSYQASQQK